MSNVRALGRSSAFVRPDYIAGVPASAFVLVVVFAVWMLLLASIAVPYFQQRKRRSRDRAD